MNQVITKNVDPGRLVIPDFNHIKEIVVWGS